MLTVTEQLKKRGELEDVGGPFYISQLTSKVASSAHIEYHARIIAQKYLARELISFTAMIQGKAFDETLDVEDLMQEAEGKLFVIGGGVSNADDDLLLDPVRELVRQEMESAVSLSVPLLVDAKVGKTWGEAH